MPDAVRLGDLLGELLDVAAGGPPTAANLAERLQRRAVASSVAGQNLSHPDWATEVGDAADVYLGFDGDVAGIHVHEDPRGWGARASLVVRHGTLADVETIVGPTAWMARNPDDFRSGERVAAYVDRAGWTVGVVTELSEDRQSVRSIRLSYPGRETPARPAGVSPPVVQPRPVPPPPLPLRSPVDIPPVAGRCPTCGADTRDAGAFCGMCGTYLEWSRPRDTGG